MFKFLTRVERHSPTYSLKVCVTKRLVYKVVCLCPPADVAPSEPHVSLPHGVGGGQATHAGAGTSRPARLPRGRSQGRGVSGTQCTGQIDYT